MTTSHSPLRILKAQADMIAATLKKAERGAEVDVRFSAKIAAARKNDSFKVRVIMDDKILTITIAWTAIRDASEASMAECILKLMKDARETVN